MFSCEFAKRGPVNFSANMEQNPGVKYEDKKKLKQEKKLGEILWVGQKDWNLKWRGNGYHK